MLSSLSTFSFSFSFSFSFHSAKNRNRQASSIEIFLVLLLVFIQSTPSLSLSSPSPQINGSNNNLVGISIGDGGRTGASITRKEWFSSILGAATATATASIGVVATTTPLISNAAETVGKDPDCNESSCLGVW